MWSRSQESISGEPRRCFRGVRNEACASRKQRDDDRKRGTGGTEHLDRKQSAADRANHGVDCVPDRIDPRNLIGEEFEQIENTGDADDPWIAENFERLILRREIDPVKVDCEASGQNGEVKINTCERSETESDAEEVKPFHRAISVGTTQCH